MKDTARFFFSVPDCECYFNKDGKILNWELYNKKEEDYKNARSVHNEHTEQKWQKKNVIGNIQIIQKGGEVKNFSDFNYLQGDKRQIVHCPFHDDKNPSAFIKRSEKSGNIYLNCSACAKTWWIQ